jgi:uncharacterized protein (DUF362 family)
MDLLTDPRVSVSHVVPQTFYPNIPPFNPSEAYPEFARFRSSTELDHSNQVYACVRNSLRLLNLDAANFGTTYWNPLQGIVRPGDDVLIKPNWVMHKHEHNDSWEQLITHGAVLRPVIDYVQLALDGRGTVSLADGPMLSSNFSEICRRAGVREMQAHYEGIPGAVRIDVLDLRLVYHETQDAVIIRRHDLSGDPRGNAIVNLGRLSAFYGFRGEGRYYGADYDTREVNEHHRGELHEYKLSGTAMQADVVIDVPKLKSHHKVGVTLALKGIVGLNCGRNWLPHRTQGTPRQGGDQFQASGFRQRAESVLVRTFEQTSLQFPKTAPNIYRFAKRLGRHVFGVSLKTIRGGGWHGNDTLWRMVHDINRALMYGDASGGLHQRPIKRRFCIVDGIIGGEGMGPTSPDPVSCGVVIAGQNPVAVDVVGAEVMGFNHLRIPQLAESFRDHSLPLIRFSADAIEIASNVAAWAGGLSDIRAASPFAFRAPLGWNGYMERCLQPLERRR